MAVELQGPEVQLTKAHYEVIVGHCFDGLPDEACGLLAGPMAEPMAEATERADSLEMTVLALTPSEQTA